VAGRCRMEVVEEQIAVLRRSGRCQGATVTVGQVAVCIPAICIPTVGAPTVRAHPDGQPGCGLSVGPRRPSASGPGLRNRPRPDGLPRRRCAQVWIQAAVLGSETYPTVGVIMRAERKAVGAALLVIDVGECCRVTIRHRIAHRMRGAGGRGRGARTRPTKHTIRPIRDTGTIDRVGATTQCSQTQSHTGHNSRLHQRSIL
jgi:hypothetical protein